MAFGVSMDRAAASSVTSSSLAKQLRHRSRDAPCKPILRGRTSLLVATIGSCSVFGCVAASNKDFSGGSPGCPCIDTTIEPWASLMKTYEEVSEGQTVLRNANGMLLQRGYGSSNCSTHDVNSRSCRKAVPSDKPWQATGMDIPDKDGQAQQWCSAAWCFVDGAHCQVRPGSDSVLLRQDTKPSHYFRGNLQYSYETCGTINTYDVKGRADMLKEEISKLPNIVLGIPPHGEQDFVFRRGLKFLLSVFDGMGVSEDKIVYRNVSEESLALRKELFMGSSWTACVHDVAIGKVDACAPMFLDLPIRRRLAPMVRMTAMPMFIMGEIENDEDIWTVLLQPFRPFTIHLWGLCIMVMLAVGCAIGVFEHEEDLVDDPDNPAPNSDSTPKVSTLGGLINSLRRTIAAATMGFADNGGSIQAKTGAGKMIQTGYAFFIVIVLASYTANTTTFLMMDNTSGLFTSIEDAIQKGLKICIADTLFEPMLTSRYPDIRNVWVTKAMWSKKSRKDVFDAFEQGDCQALLESEFKLQHLHGKGKFCKVEAIGRPIHSYGWGYPMRKALLPHVSWGILQSEMKGGFVDIETLHPPPQTTCPNAAVEDAAEKPLQARHMMGSVLIVAATIFAAACGRIFRRLEHMVMPKAEERMEKGIRRVSSIRFDRGSSDASKSKSSRCESDLEQSDRACAKQDAPQNTEAEVPVDDIILERSEIQCLKTELSDQSKDWLRQCIEDAVQRTAAASMESRCDIATSSNACTPRGGHNSRVISLLDRLDNITQADNAGVLGG